MAGVLLEARPYRPFKSSEEYLYAMKEDLAEWLNILYSDLEINVDNFMDKLETGVVLCKVRLSRFRKNYSTQVLDDFNMIILTIVSCVNSCVLLCAVVELNTSSS